MHTEDDARKLWCPMARKTNAANRPLAVGLSLEMAGVGCIASDCAMWRWGQDDAAFNERAHGREAVSEFGYCGLAGNPTP